jgi:hypothetical protein
LTGAAGSAALKFAVTQAGHTSTDPGKSRA